MDRLWAPWRLKYVTQVIDKGKGCLFCDLARSRGDKRHRVFVRFPQSYAVLNLYPYNNGHTLVVPLRHVRDLRRLKPEETAELIQLVNYTQELLDEVLSPDGYNIGMNLGRTAGAGVPGHVHFHVVPRWRGDLNFMPVVAGTKVISQSREALYARLVSAQRKRLGK